MILSVIILLACLYVAFVVTRFMFYQDVLMLFEFKKCFGFVVYYDTSDTHKMFQVILPFLTISTQWEKTN